MDGYRIFVHIIYMYVRSNLAIFFWIVNLEIVAAVSLRLLLGGREVYPNERTMTVSRPKMAI